MHRLAICCGAVLAAFAGHTAARAAAHPGRPDLEGVWTTASYTQLQRPRGVGPLVLTPEEARAYEAKVAPTHGVVLPGKDVVGQLDSEFSDSGDGLARIRGQARTSWIVAPADGRLPFTPAGRAYWERKPAFDGPEDRPPAERCLSGPGSSPPQLSTQDANLLEIVQTPSWVGLRSEKNHDMRLIALDRRRDPRQPASWAGDSIGRYEGPTLVVETQGFRSGVVDRLFLVHSSEAKVVERFTRVSPGEIAYSFTLMDPMMFTQPVQGEMVFRRTAGPIYEFACHEGNKSLVNVLTAARLGRQGPARPPAPAPAAP